MIFLPSYLCLALCILCCWLGYGSFSPLNGEVQWVASSNLSLWYQPWELCILNTSSTEMKKKALMAKCMKDHGKDRDNVVGFHCRAGGAFHGSPCWDMDSTQHSFRERKHLTRAVVGYDDPSRSYLQEAVAGAARQNASLLMIGDSLMYQFGVAATCELRRQYSIIDDRPAFSSDFPSPYIQLREPRWNVPSRLVRIDIYHNGADIERLLMDAIGEFLAISQRVYVIISGGVHCNHRHLMEQLARTTLRTMHNITERHPNIVFLYLETPATHFDTSNGYWNRSQTHCVAIRDLSPTADWRNEIVRRYIQEHSLTNIRMIYLRKLTEPMHREHVLGNFKDCTHYCWSPMMYQYVFAQIARIIINNNNSSSSSSKSSS